MTKQKELWEGQFGDDYTARNAITDQDLKHRTMFWSTVLNTFGPDIPHSILEVGAGNGINLQAIDTLYKIAKEKVLIGAVEINERARLRLLDQNIATDIYPSTESVIQKYDMVFTSGVLIHVHPDDLLKTTKEIYRLSNKYVFCVEYFRPEPETKPYRGQNEALYMRDFGSWYLDNFPLQCLNYGFFWKRVTGLDNLTYWLFKKAH